MSNQRAKPWEVSSGTSAAAATGAATGVATGVATGTATGTENSLTLPPREYATNDTNGTTQGEVPGSYGGMRYGSGGMGGYGLGSGLGGLGGLGGFGTGLGGYGGLGGGFGGFGGYGGYGGLGGGYGGYGGYGMNGDMANGGGLAQSTQATFQLIESIIGAVGGFAQMLEATYMATQSSFFTMMSLGEQFGNLRNAFGSIFGIFALIKYVKKVLHKLTGNKVFREKLEFSASEFEEFSSRGGKEGTKKRRISMKPLIFFLAAVFGVPYLLNKLVKVINKQQQQLLEQRKMANGSLPLDPKQIEFCRALYDFNPEDTNVELPLKTGNIYAIISKKDPFGKDSKWWKCRSKDGTVGFVPYNYVELIHRK